MLATPRARSTCGVLLVTLTALTSACGDDGPSSPSGTEIRVTVTTTGAPEDPDGYQLSVDGGAAQNIETDGTVTFEDIASGAHTVLLTGVATNCAVSAENPRTVTVDAGETTETIFNVTCAAPAETAIRVTVATTGSPEDPDGYQVSVDAATPQNTETNGVLTFGNLASGAHTVLLTGLATNCTVGAENPRTVNVAAGTTAETTFDVFCAADIAGRLAYVSSGDAASDDIFVTNSDGTAPTNITNSLATDVRPSWSPDGTKLAFVSNPDGDFEIFVMNADGSDITNISNSPGEDDYPEWSPDGSKIAFVSGRDGNLEVYTMNADGSDQVRITNSAGEDASPTWSPDGSQLAFHAESDFWAGDLDIFLVNSDGSGDPQNITNSPSMDRLPEWSPDGTTIAFVSNRDNEVNEIYTTTPDGSEVVRLTNNPFSDTEPTWSPDGTQIAYTSDRSVEGGAGEIIVINADGTGEMNVTNAPRWESSPDWGP